MDTQFHPNNLNNSSSNYNTFPGISPHQLQQNPNLPTHTLPPLQNSPHNPMQPMYGSSAPQTPRTLATPNTPTSATMMTFPQMGQATSRFQLLPNNSQHARGYQMMTNNNEQSYRAMTTMVPQSPGTPSMSYPQAIAPAPQNRLPQAIRSLSHSGMHIQGGMQSPCGQNNILSQMSDMEPPTHVVGSQGRRGILPSAPGRPPVNSNTGKNTLIPVKDADGKFPCPHCTKTYLHAKHLKRHLLRHTGDRPYMCILCRDTFSRSDILKRHFQKCSIRRGNPTGASHLSHSQAHLRKSHPTPPNKNLNENTMVDINSMGASNGGIQIFGVNIDTAVAETSAPLSEHQADQVQSSGIKRLCTSGENDGRNMTAISPGAPGRSNINSTYAGPNSGAIPSGMSSSVTYNMSHSQNGTSYNQGYDYAPNGNNNATTHAARRNPIKRDDENMNSYNRNQCLYRETQSQV